jgi:hypothetical protein
MDRGPHRDNRQGRNHVLLSLPLPKLYDHDPPPTNFSVGAHLKFRELFDLFRDGDELLAYFDGVTTPQQLVSRLEQLKRQDPEGMFDALENLRMSHDNALEANIELGGALVGETDASDDLLKDLNDFSAQLVGTESQPSGDEKPPEVESSSSQEAK